MLLLLMLLLLMLLLLLFLLITYVCANISSDVTLFINRTSVQETYSVFIVIVFVLLL